MKNRINLDLLVKPSYASITYNVKPGSGYVYVMQNDLFEKIERQMNNMSSYREAIELIDFIRKK